MLEIMDEILCALVESKAWNRIDRMDPRIKQAEEELSNELDALNLSRDQRDEVEEAITTQCSACIEAAIIYGMYVMQSIQQTIKEPELLSKHILERIKEAKQ